jgi:glucose-1-phosphate adenylyltransferase
MVSSKKVLGIIFANMHDKIISDLTEVRTMGSVPFGGRYRLIDFTLSNMVNSGISEVGLITKSNYQSLMDHLGSGAEWDLSRKNGGLKILPPFGHKNQGIYRGRIEALSGALQFIRRSTQNHVLLSDCDIVANLNYKKIINNHISSDADITIGYAKKVIDSKMCSENTVINFDENKRVTNVLINPEVHGEFNVSLNIMVISKQLLEDIIDEFMSKGQFIFDYYVLQNSLDRFKINAFEYSGFISKINSIKSYYKANMDLLNQENRDDLFDEKKSIYTKIRDEAPVKYGIDAHVKNSLIADGCIIEGTIENSIIFRGVRIEAGAKVKNSIVMQSGIVGKNCELNYVITDKNVIIGDYRSMLGSEDYPVYVTKNATV